MDSSKVSRPPLTHQALRDIGLRNRDHADTTALLWEIKRLRSIVLRADQLQRCMTSLPGAYNMILEALRNQLKDEPCVIESNQLRDEMLRP